ncbi:hypothetical protein F4808DRAFT_421698 [Astrocystis sublimbata]|nr:hypothetical protein F4808DRAFT_421698 [Astrocystis sublimbata]
MSTQTRRKLTASHNICTPCRARKVSCDGHRAVCGNCERLGFRCSFPLATPLRVARPEAQQAQHESAVFSERRRVRRACHECHARKTRCSGDSPSCGRCRHLGIECVYHPSRRPGRPSTTTLPAVATPTTTDVGSAGRVNFSDQDSDSRASSEVPVNPSESGLAVSMTERFATPHPQTQRNGTVEAAVKEAEIALPPGLTVEGVLDLYFIHLHPLPCFAFLHKVTVIQRYRAGLLDDALLLAILSITVLLTQPIGLQDSTADSWSPVECSMRWIDTAENMVLRDVSRQSVIKVQTLLFVTHHRLLMLRSSDSFITFALAARMAFGVRLNFENPRPCFLARESRRRLMWALFILDNSLASGMAHFRLCREVDIHIKMPCGERNFELDLEPSPADDPGTIEHAGQSSRPASDDSLVAFNIQIAAIRFKILRYSKQLVCQQHQAILDHSAQLRGEILQLDQELNIFSDHLGPSLALSNKNFQLRTYSPNLAQFVKLHLSWHQSRCDLYRLMLDGLHEALPGTIIQTLDQEFVTRCRDTCYQSAFTVSRLFAALSTLDRNPLASDQDIPVFAYQCARVILYSERGNTLTPQSSTCPPLSQSVTQSAGSCYEVVARLPCFTPATACIRDDIKSLLERGAVPDSSEASPMTPVSNDTIALGSRREILSRHSFIRNVGQNDDSESFTLPQTNPSPTISGTIDLGNGKDYDRMAISSASQTCDSTIEANQPRSGLDHLAIASAMATAPPRNPVELQRGLAVPPNIEPFVFDRHDINSTSDPSLTFGTSLTRQQPQSQPYLDVDGIGMGGYVDAFQDAAADVDFTFDSSCGVFAEPFGVKSGTWLSR